MPLLERGEQLAALGEYAGEARRGHGRLVLTAGEAKLGVPTRRAAAIRAAELDLAKFNPYA